MARATVTGGDVRALARDVAVDFQYGELLTWSSAIAFRALFSLVPFVLFGLALLGFLQLTELWTVSVAPMVQAAVGGPTFVVVDGTVRQILMERQTFWLTVGLALTVWELSSAVRATAGAFDRIYGIDDERAF